MTKLTPVGSIGDALLSYLINDKPSFKALVAKNRAALKSSSEKLAAWCEEQGWKPVPVNSGHFMMVDAKNLGFKNMEEEKEFGRVCVEYGVGVVRRLGWADGRNFDPVDPVHADQISTAPGATGALDQLFYVLGDSGDAVLLAAPQ